MKSAAFVFPGYGAHHLRMIEALPTPERVTPYLDAAEALTGRPIALIEQQGPEQLLNDPMVAIPALLLADIGWAEALRSEGVQPRMLAGHGVGEYAALAVSGAISIGAALSLVIARTRIVAAATAGTDGASAVVTGLSPDVVAGIMTGPTGPWISQVNSPRHVVIAGAMTEIERVTPSLLEAGATRVLPITAEGALHTSWYDRAAHEYAALLDDTEFRDAKVTVVPNATGVSTTSGDELRAALSAQLNRPVRWQQTLESFAIAGVDYMVECGPGASLISFGHPNTIAVIAPSQVGLEDAVARLGG